jgi:hypothetical protein
LNVFELPDSLAEELPELVTPLEFEAAPKEVG